MNQNIVTIKGTPKCLVIHIDTQFDFSQIKTALRKHISHGNGFFKGAKFKFQPSKDTLSPEQCKKLEQICLEYGLTPIIDISTIDMESRFPEDNNFQDRSVEVLNKFLGVSETELREQSHFISKSIRNGDKLAFKGNVILLGDINPGSEIVATGNIIVMGSVKGIVHAGAEGDLNSFIVASILDPLQIRIGSLIACKPETNESIKNHTPEIARVDKDQIIISPYLTSALSKAN
ncbi:septum site-determining protein MinC [Desulfitibacter alkalitolerans]|uniref:septum site-determining protein MinC n=1 Tax=Desulfitibacter alkalitolerans TaxID=264641 RepID=UPI00048021E3|nr:septum site-determining protein MinC [Desulfitibacter alkalitolerans]